MIFLPWIGTGFLIGLGWYHVATRLNARLAKRNAPHATNARWATDYIGKMGVVISLFGMLRHFLRESYAPEGYDTLLTLWAILCFSLSALCGAYAGHEIGRRRRPAG